MTPDPRTTGVGGAPDDDQIQPFQLEATHLRGRLVRLGGVLDGILTRHDYPEPVARLLGETLALAVALATALKYDGVFTLQTRSDGPIRLLVADVVHSAAEGRTVRAYAQFDPERLAAAGPDADRTALIGTGHLAFTVDQGEDMERYQGIVALSGATLAECVQHYFRQSEQLDTGIRVHVGRSGGGSWRAGAMMVQRLPVAKPASNREDDWRRTMVLLGSCTPDEMLDPALPAHDLLFRLFHEEGVRVFQPDTVRFGCRCSLARVETMLRGLPRAEVEDLRVDDKVVITCQFCNSAYAFDDAQLDQVYGGRSMRLDPLSGPPVAC